jgi:hypothetical protein
VTRYGEFTCLTITGASCTTRQLPVSIAHSVAGATDSIYMTVSAVHIWRNLPNLQIYPREGSVIALSGPLGGNNTVLERTFAFFHVA